MVERDVDTNVEIISNDGIDEFYQELFYEKKGKRRRRRHLSFQQFFSLWVY